MAEAGEKLRHLVLWPHKPRDFVRLDEDEDGDHFGAFFPSQDKPVAVISMVMRDRTSARFRKFACHPDFQGRGIGTKLLNYLASHCWSMGAKILWCDARLSSSQWYQKRGLVSFGDTFFKESVEYTRMKMDLVNTQAS
ncbi:hypothetical protein PAXINDRAFT_163184 [Paxillus involutus ATCC 200175]|uniref:Unplaced genomic scaffold PAXINscaffold_17, whole genome shotgun sequence n=1 Tax=Paxillus involutus ATCC 200175 TaxID=664439 RepID=A0A0C9U744_PAXIN|nr:hypothetical protein PAXINDRAFT_163184 [Paxillus involutus ATCC 200175]